MDKSAVVCQVSVIDADGELVRRECVAVQIFIDVDGGETTIDLPDNMKFGKRGNCVTLNFRTAELIKAIKNGG